MGKSVQPVRAMMARSACGAVERVTGAPLDGPGIAVVNKSTLVDADSAATMVLACNVQLAEHVVPRWQRGPMGVAFYENEADVPAGAFPMFLLDDSDQAGALGYHDETPEGKVYGRVFAKPVLDNGGDLLTKPMSVASVLSHECVELYGDPSCNIWASSDGSTSYAYELADPVEADTYLIPAGGQQVTVSNFVLPAWFDPHATTGPFDYLNALKAPFTMTTGGYVIVEHESKVTERYGEVFPDWKRGTKRFPAARTSKRLGQ